MINKNNKGFSLIELVIVVAIIGILGAVSYPSYIQHVTKSKRTDAKTALYQIAQDQEAYFIRNMKYASTLAELTGSASAVASLPSPEEEYNITMSCTTSGSTCLGYIATATPNSNKGQVRDTSCVTMTLNQLGQEAALDSTNSDSTDECW